MRSKFGASTTVYVETSVVYIHVVWCCTVVLRPWVLEFAGICVSRSLQSFGEATRLPRMLVACRSVLVRLFWCRYLAMLESCVASLWRHCTWSHSCPITSTCTCALCGLTLRRCFPTLAGVFVLLAVVWRTRATGSLSEVFGFVCLRCLDLWSTIVGLVHCPLGFYGTFVLLSSSKSLQIYSWPVSSGGGNYVCSVTCYLVCICF